MRWVIRITAGRESTMRVDPTFLEQLRYAGLARINATLGGVQVFDLVAPCGNTPDSKIWADRNSERMRSFGYNAVAAPATED